VGARVTSNVGDGMSVSVGSGVGLGVSVGGMGVIVGMAACVSAILVDAPATAVFCMSTTLTVGVAPAPQALITIAKTITNVLNFKCFILVRDLLLYVLTIRVASAQCQNLVVSHNDFPGAFGDAKPAKHFEVLLAVDECPGTVLSDRAGKAVAVYIKIATFSQVCYNI